MLAGEIVPLFCGSAELTYGTAHAAQEDGRAAALARGGRSRRPTAPLVGRVFKTLSEPHVGDVTLFRLYAGELKNGDEVWNAEHEVAEKLNHLSVQQGKERVEVERLSRGRHRVGGQAQATPTPATPSAAGMHRCDCRRSRSPRPWRPRPCW